MLVLGGCCCTPRARSPLVIRNFMANYAAPPPMVPVGLELKFRVEELPASSSPFHAEKKKREHQTMTGAEIIESMNKSWSTRFSPKNPQEIANFVLTSGFMVFFFWITNFAVPNYVFKDTLFRKKDSEEEDVVNVVQIENSNVGEIVYKTEDTTRRKGKKARKKLSKPRVARTTYKM